MNGRRRDQGVKVVWTFDEMVARSGNEIQLTEFGIYVQRGFHEATAADL